MDRGRGRGDNDRRLSLLGRDDRAGNTDDLDFNPAEFDEVFAAPTSAQSDLAHFEALSAQGLRDLAILKAGVAKLEALSVDGLRKAADRDKAIAERVIDPKQLAAYAATGAKQGAETALASLQREQADERTARKALVDRLDAEDQARRKLLGRQLLHARILTAIGVVALLAALGAGWMGYAKGRDSGYNAAYAEAHDEKAAVDWANTPNGRTARQMARLNPELMAMLSKCSGQGWTQKSQQGRDACFPSPGTGWWVH
ncbi:hypothetical protein [Sphingomonas oligoaromativorans]|uniref:hypothetical protein n=1 Tax=Sphingomonas oligoaromativorans TaxID=575322 RepID=UPI00142205A7|nr:hypothetical protein [Sphingomonas oligoaromativorans]NIJ35310.1 hypothetical protein [Sphingomonas oligoaromativorans]